MQCIDDAVSSREDMRRYDVCRLDLVVDRRGRRKMSGFCTHQSVISPITSFTGNFGLEGARLRKPCRSAAHV